MANPSDKKFEDALRELEGIVEKLETGDLSLEAALSAFEEGVVLVRLLDEKLTGVEKRVEVLTRDQGGAFQLETVAEDEEEE
ncbi:MAG: exodeoxyribonuclease VII small subunit [Candidatus Binatia bacterium]